MIIKNKTNSMQKITLSDGSVVTARFFRTITLDEKIKELNPSIWEQEKVAEKKTDKIEVKK